MKNFTDAKAQQLWNILAKQESARIQERNRELEIEEYRASRREERLKEYDIEEDIKSARLTCEYTGPEERDPEYDYDSLQSDDDWLQRHANKLWANHVPPVTSNGLHSRSYDWDPHPDFDGDRSLSREYYHVQEDEEDLFPKDQLPGSVEELYEYLDEQLKNEEEYPYASEEEADYYLKNQDPCFMCSEYNYTNVMFDADRMRIICRDCYPKVKQCDECDTLTKDQTCYNFETGVRLCFDCNFKTEERVQMPLEEHLLVRRDIQHLRRQYFDILVDYAELAEFTIFDAYRYKSKCHFYDCIQKMSPSGWCAEETLAFCCRRHREYSEDCGCHCTNVWNGTDYDDHYEEATCKICNSPHEANVASRVALRKSDQGVKPIVSAISMFEEISMSNVLFMSLVDLCEYFN